MLICLGGRGGGADEKLHTIIDASAHVATFNPFTAVMSLENQ